MKDLVVNEELSSLVEIILGLTREPTALSFIPPSTSALLMRVQ